MKTNWYYRWNLPGCLPDSDTPFEDSDSFEATKAALVETLESRIDDECAAADGDDDRGEEIQQWQECIDEVRGWTENDCPNFVTGPDNYNYVIDTIDED